MRLPAIIKGHRLKLFVRLVANGMFQAVLAVGSVLLIRFAFDRLITAVHISPFPLMLWVASGLLMAAGCMAWLHIFERIDAERMGQDYVHRIRMMLFDHMSELTPRALQKRSRGAIVLRFVGDLNALKNWVSLGLVRVTVAGVTTMIAALALSFINWVLALGVAIFFSMGAVYALSLGKPLREAVKESRRWRSYLASNVNEKVASMAVVQAFGQSDRERRRIRRQSRNLQGAMIDRARKVGLLRAVTQGTIALASGAVLLLGAKEVAAGRATPGTVVAAITIVGLLAPLLRDLGRVYEYWQGARVSSKKIEEFLNTPALVTEVASAPDLKPGPGRLEFVEVGLSGSLRGLNAVAEPGTRVALVGPNGAGKSTLLWLACRLLDPDEGGILLDGQDLSKHTLSSVRRAISMASLDLPLIRGTVDKNLRYRWPDAPAEEIARVRALCEIDKMEAEMVQGDQTRLTEGGSNLSIGQRQRIVLARALLGNPSILLLDEADTHLDDEANRVLDKVVAEYQGTIIMATHRLERLAQADLIWRLENGALVEANPVNSLHSSSMLSLESGHLRGREDAHQ